MKSLCKLSIDKQPELCYTGKFGSLRTLASRANKTIEEYIPKLFIGSLNNIPDLKIRTILMKNIHIVF